MVLGAAAMAVLVALVLLGLTGVIGGRDTPRRDAVADYIEQVNATAVRERQKVFVKFAFWPRRWLINDAMREKAFSRPGASKSVALNS